MHRMLPAVHGACSGAYGAPPWPSVPILPSSDPPPLSLPLSRQSPPRCCLLSGALPQSRALSPPPPPPPPLWQLPPYILAQLVFSMAIAEGLRAQIIFKGDRPAGAP